MKRKLFTLFSALSFLLLLAACVMWVRSYWRADVIGYRSVDDAQGRTHDLAVAFMSGKISLTRSWWDAPTDPAERGWRLGERVASPGYSVDGGAGFEHRRVTGPGRGLTEMRFPMWAVAALLAVAPAFALQQWIRRRRLRAGASDGRCATCGYDLTGNTGRCPECGTPAPAR